jgi:hypothetical protein
MYDIPFDRSFHQLSNGIRHVMPSTDRKLELTAKASMAQPVSQPAVYANGLKNHYVPLRCVYCGIHEKTAESQGKFYVTFNCKSKVQ